MDDKEIDAIKLHVAGATVRHHFVTAKHLQRYCNENAYRFNNRALAQDERFADALANCNGRLKYQDLIAN